MLKLYSWHFIWGFLFNLLPRNFLSFFCCCYVDHFKVFIEFIITILFLLYVLFCFFPEACGILAPQPGIEPHTLEGEVSTTGPLRKSLAYYLDCAVLKAQRRQWHPTPVLLPGKSHGRRSLVGCSPRGREESDTTEQFHFHFSLSCIGEGSGNPLQCSCLENPRDSGTW